jgi:hypothetical protein
MDQTKLHRKLHLLAFDVPHIAEKLQLQELTATATVGLRVAGTKSIT